MIKRTVIYLLIVCLTVYCFFMYEDAILSGLLAAEAVYFLIGMTEVLFKRRKLRLNTIRCISIADPGQLVPVALEVENLSRRCAVLYRIDISVENAFFGENRRVRLTGEAAGQEKKQIPFKVYAGECGMLRIRVKQWRIYDRFFIFQWVGRSALQQKIGVMPKCHVIGIEVTRRTRECLADAEEYSDKESGDDASEIYQVREYREKDSIHDIHWKLSAKAGTADDDACS